MAIMLQTFVSNIHGALSSLVHRARFLCDHDYLNDALHNVRTFSGGNAGATRTFAGLSLLT